MAGNFYSDNNDSMDIKELATLNEDISDDFIDKLQQQLSNNIGGSTNSDAQNIIDQNDDSTLFEEQTQQPVKDTTQTSEQKDNETKSNSEKKSTTLNTNFDDNFIKKYKAKLNKKSQEKTESSNIDQKSTEENTVEQQQGPIETISQGNIKEKPLTQELKDYNNSLDFLDENVKYSKYVIYIDPQNVDFIEGLTVKERKNLINGILRQQDDIAVTKQRFKVIQVVIRHAIIAILTIAISIPVIYYVINASLEATIDNHRRSQSNWQTLYKEHGKITPR